MHEGSCGCEAIKLKLKGEPIAVGLCHCVDCRKLSGAPFTYNFIAKCSDFEITGSPKAVARAGGSGGAVKNFFCSDCGSPLFGGTLSPNGELETVVVRAGIFDDIGFLHRRRPAVEIYTSQRLEWLAPVDGCAQFEGMLPGGLPKEE